MNKSEILSTLPRLSHQERRAIIGYILELESEAQLLADHDRRANENFLLLDKLETEDAKTSTIGKNL